MVTGRDVALTIQSVEKVAAQSEVFHLSVSGTRTFFASGATRSSTGCTSLTARDSGLEGLDLGGQTGPR